MAANQLEQIHIEWPLAPRVMAFTTTRRGGVSTGDFDSLNLAQHVSDDSVAVAENRRRLANAHPQVRHWQWLEQVHGTAVLQLEPGAELPISTPTADAIVCREQDVACCVMTADCLPVFLASQTGDELAVVHAGWRGLAAGVLEQTVASMQSKSDDLLAAFGPAIGPRHFEVGGEVLAELGFSTSEAAGSGAFNPSANADKWFADLFLLAELRLQSLGVSLWQSPRLCTYEDASRFYSHRRSSHSSQASGRMASCIYLKSS